MTNVLSLSAVRVAPAFDGAVVLPRVAAWPALRERLLSQALERELDPGAFFQLTLGRRYASQLQALGLQPGPVSVRVEAASEGVCATLTLRSGLRAVEDRWELELDANGVLRDFRSEHGTGDGIYNAEDFSRFFDALLSGL